MIVQMVKLEDDVRNLQKTREKERDTLLLTHIPVHLRSLILIHIVQTTQLVQSQMTPYLTPALPVMEDVGKGIDPQKPLSVCKQRVEGAEREVNVMERNLDTSLNGVYIISCLLS